MEQEKRTSGKDDFWDLEALLPARKRTTVSAAERDVSAVEILQNAPTLRGAALTDSLFVEHPVSLHPPRRDEQEPLEVYHPQNTLLREVRVYPWRTEYDYYEAFARHARALYHKEGVECPAVDFFSYAPQYTQMNAAQMAYYLWWRQCFREGKCLPAAHSYQLLYLYEIINLGDLIPPAEGQREMLRLWLSYRESNPRLDALLREWLVDYSLLYRLSAPELPRKLYRDLLSGAKLKEFFVPLGGQIGESADSLTAAILLFCNNYDYTKSKFYTPESASEYHRVLRGSVRVALDFLRERDGELLMGKSGVSTVSRDTFMGAICSFRLRRRIEVDYTSFSRTHELRYLMSDVLKYAENALRARRGIKSRLSIYAVDSALRERLDAYLESALPPRATRGEKKAIAVEPPAYEKRYDLPVRAPSLARAAEIESASWETTKRLIEAFGELEEEETVPNGIEKVQETPTVAQNATQLKNEEQTLATALGELAAFLSLKGAGAQRAFALARGMMVDAIVDKINTVAGDMLGDILLEESDDGYAVIEDYLEILIGQGVLSDGE